MEISEVANEEEGAVEEDLQSSELSIASTNVVNEVIGKNSISLIPQSASRVDLKSKLNSSNRTFRSDFIPDFVAPKTSARPETGTPPIIQPPDRYRPEPSYPRVSREHGNVVSRQSHSPNEREINKVRTREIEERTNSRSTNPSRRSLPSSREEKMENLNDGNSKFVSKDEVIFFIFIPYSYYSRISESAHDRLSQKREKRSTIMESSRKQNLYWIVVHRVLTTRTQTIFVRMVVSVRNR